MDQSLARHLDTFLVNGGVGTVATLASMSIDDGGDGDQRNENIREINNLRLDVGALNKTVSDLVTRLRNNGLIQT